MKKNLKNIFTLKTILLSIVFCLGFGEVYAQAADTSGVDRYAIYIGSNVGGKNNQRLLYAGTDAISFQKTMSDIGGIPKANSMLLLDPSRSDVDDAMAHISELISRNKHNSKRSEFVFYYSGHSDENALLLGKTSYDYSQLKAAITEVPSDVHVVILDSCYSGNFIRTKGGSKQKPFLVDDASVVKGHAYLSSSSSLESSQESDEIGSSFFTNAMITGLRGAADSSGDKKVTLNELYSYAFNETLSKTENTSVGPQHPNYNITLVGSGDLILSDISNSDSVVMIAKNLEGRVIIRDKNNKLVSEVNKTSEKPLYLALEEGQYAVTVINPNATFQGSFTLKSGKTYVLSASNLTPVTRVANRTRGEEQDGLSENDAALISQNTEDNDGKADNEKESDKEKYFFPFTFSFGWNEFQFNHEKDLSTTIALGLFSSQVYEVRGLQLSTLANVARNVNGAQISGLGNMAYKVNGVQGTGLVNIARDVNGVQGSGLVNFARDVKGVQGTGLVNVARNVSYVQGAGIANVAIGKARGVQGAGITNYATGLDGVQGSGIGNVCVGGVNGLQGAGIFNVSVGNVNGVQASGIVNVAKDVNGVQAGLVNVANEVKGLQIGLVNISKNGVCEIGASYTSDNNIRMTFNTGSKNLYGVLGTSFDVRCLSNQISESDRAGVFILGIGSRVQAGIFNFDFEVLANEAFLGLTQVELYKYKVETEWFPSVRCSIGFTPVKHLMIFGGAMMSFEFEGNNRAFEKRTNNLVIHTDDSKVNFHPEFDVGLRFSFN